MARHEEGTAADTSAGDWTVSGGRAHGASPDRRRGRATARTHSRRRVEPTLGTAERGDAPPARTAPGVGGLLGGGHARTMVKRS